MDAVAYAQTYANVDSNRIYLTGCSGGGMMALMMAAKHPEIWAGVSAWCGISDLAARRLKVPKSCYTQQYMSVLI